jgi:hypothetical protein
MEILAESAMNREVLPAAFSSGLSSKALGGSKMACKALLNQPGGLP